MAQTNVGEIYEKGFGTAPDYANAAKWYQKAADQGYPRALINLGFLYEQGLGVPKDPVAALKLYRKAAGIEGTISLEGAGRPRPRRNSTRCARSSSARGRNSRRPVDCSTRNGSSRAGKSSA